MANYVKYSTNAQTRALKMGNFWLGPVNDGKGPTSSTGYYTAKNPPSGGFTIYLNKSSNGPSIFQASNESQLVSITNQLGGTSFTTSAQCLTWYVTQTDKFCVNREYEGIVTNGLVLNLDAGFTPSYPTSGTSWYDMGPNGNNGTLTNGPTFSGDSIVFDGVDDWITFPAGSNFAYGTGDFTVECWFYDTSSTSIPFSVLYSQTESGTNYFLFGVVSNQVSWRGTLSGGGTGISASGTYSRNTWNHAVASRISGVVTVYLNAVGGTPTSNTTNFTNTTFVPTIGDESHHGANNSWTGYIPIFRLYKGKGLTSSEVLQNFNAQKGRFGL
jgi:hypothetical protein